MKDVKFIWYTDQPPTHQQVYDEQASRGYHPLGYAGPYDIRTNKGGDGRYTTTWFCHESAD